MCSSPSRVNAEVEPFENDYKIPPLELNDKSESESGQSPCASELSETEVSPKKNEKKRMRPTESVKTLSKQEMVIKAIKRLKI